GTGRSPSRIHVAPSAARSLPTCSSAQSGRPSLPKVFRKSETLPEPAAHRSGRREGRLGLWCGRRRRRPEGLGEARWVSERPEGSQCCFRATRSHRTARFGEERGLALLSRVGG